MSGNIIKATVMSLTFYGLSSAQLMITLKEASSHLNLISVFMSLYRRTNEMNHCSRPSWVLTILAPSTAELLTMKTEVLKSEFRPNFRVLRSWDSRSLRSFRVKIFQKYHLSAHHPTTSPRQAWSLRLLSVTFLLKNGYAENHRMQDRGRKSIEVRTLPRVQTMVSPSPEKWNSKVKTPQSKSSVLCAQVHALQSYWSLAHAARVGQGTT